MLFDLGARILVGIVGGGRGRLLFGAELGAVVLLLATGSWLGCAVERAQRRSADDAFVAQYRRQVRINDSTVVELAAAKAKLKEVQGLALAARELNGKLEAGIKVVLRGDTARGRVTARPETVFVAESTRLVSRDSVGFPFRDSTSAGVLRGDVTVARDLSGAAIEYEFVPSPISPEIGFVRIGGKYVAVVTCSSCATIRLEAPFADFRPPPPPLLRREFRAGWDVVGRTWTVAAALDVRAVAGLLGFVEVRQRLVAGETATVLLGVKRSF
jgi:hypothetical protein